MALSATSVQIGPDRRPAVLTLVRPVPNTSPLHQVLTGAGYYVWRANNAAEAMTAALSEHDVGILICDTMLPNGTGVAFYETLLSKLPPGRPLVAIFMADAASINDVVATLRAGALDFLGRRIPPEQLVDVVRRAEQVVLQRRSLQALAGDVERMRDLATLLGQRLSSGAHLAGSPVPGAAAEAGFENLLPMDDGPDSLHARSLVTRRQRQVVTALRAQSIRQRVFGEIASSSASWSMLLDLYVSTLRGQAVSVSSLCLASGAATTTALRRLDELVDEGLIVRVKDTGDARRTLVTLTEDALDRINAYLDAIA